MKYSDFFLKIGFFSKVLFLLCLGGTMVPQTVSAHHSFAGAYHLDKPINIEGKVVDWKWVSPHVQIYVEADAGDGSSIVWDVELGAPRALRVHLGWSVDMIQIGDEIKIAGYLSRSDEHGAAAGRIILANGEELRAVRQIE